MPGRALREAVATLLAALACLACTLAIDRERGPAILAVVLCLSLSRSQLDRDLRGRLEAALALPLVSLAALGVAWLLHHMPWVGAAAFTAAIGASIWLRRFGTLGRRAGTLIALPFVVILVTPYVPPRHLGPAMVLMMPVIVALLALFWVSAVHGLGQRLGLLRIAVQREESALPAPVAGGMRPIASTRMALQMALALAVAFVVGYGFFAERWAWIVLTAFIVGSGNRGRLDVAYKSVLRVLGAAAGSIAALVFGGQMAGHGGAAVGLMLAALFLGVWLRPLGYGWWALFITLALAVLQGFNGDAAAVQGVLWLRLEEIVIGALIAVAAAWFVLPVRSADVLRRRLADALAALAKALEAPGHGGSKNLVLQFDHIEEMAPSFRAVRHLARHLRIVAVQPADWIDELAACRVSALALVEGGTVAPGQLRKAVGAARKALRDPATLAPALREMRAALDAAAPEPRGEGAAARN